MRKRKNKGKLHNLLFQIWNKTEFQIKHASGQNPNPVLSKNGRPLLFCLFLQLWNVETARASSGLLLTDVLEQPLSHKETLLVSIISNATSFKSIHAWHKGVFHILFLYNFVLSSINECPMSRFLW